jgi:ATP10 protein
MPQDKPTIFPNCRGKNLNGKRFSLPKDFGGEKNIVFIAFTRDQQRSVDTWLPFAKEQSRLRPNTTLYEIPVIGQMIGPVQSMIDGGMRRGIPDTKTRDITITLYLNKKRFRSTLILPDERRIYALLVDKKGLVLWRSEGDFTPEKGASLQKALQP